MNLRLTCFADESESCQITSLPKNWQVATDYRLSLEIHNQGSQDCQVRGQLLADQTLSEKQRLSLQQLQVEQWSPGWPEQALTLWHLVEDGWELGQVAAGEQLQSTLQVEVLSAITNQVVIDFPFTLQLSFACHAGAITGTTTGTTSFAGEATPIAPSTERTASYELSSASTPTGLFDSLVAFFSGRSFFWVIGLLLVLLLVLLRRRLSLLRKRFFFAIIKRQHAKKNKS